MELIASVPVLLGFVAVLYFASCRIIDHEIRSAEREFGLLAEAAPAPADAQASAGSSSVETGRTRGGSGAIGG